MRLLIVEDEARIAELLVESLRDAGFVTDTAADAAAAVGAIVQTNYDAVILDIGLPGPDGFTVLAGLRASGWSIPVLILSARDSIDDRVLGLDSGADDYLVKPFDMTELVSRVKALLRRPGGALGVVLEAGNVTFDTVGRDARVNGLAVELARRETAVLEQMLRRVGRVVPKDFLEDKLYGNDEELESNAVPVHVHHLRKKLEKAGSTAIIHTVRGVGYIMMESKV